MYFHACAQTLRCAVGAQADVGRDPLSGWRLHCAIERRAPEGVAGGGRETLEHEDGGSLGAAEREREQPISTKGAATPTLYAPTPQLHGCYNAFVLPARLLL